MCRCRMLKQWTFAVFFLCLPVPLHGGSITGLGNRVKRSVTDAQLMHDKGQALQDLKRRLWLQELLHQVHTAVIQDSVRPGLLGHHVTSRTGQHPKKASMSKTLHLQGQKAHFSQPQETEKALRYRSQSLKVAGQRRTWFGKWSPKEKKSHQVHSVLIQRRQQH